MNEKAKVLEELVIAHNLRQKNLRHELVMIELRIRRLEDHLNDTEYSQDDYDVLLTLREIAENLRVQTGKVENFINWNDDLPF